MSGPARPVLRNSGVDVATLAVPALRRRSRTGTIIGDRARITLPARTDFFIRRVREHPPPAIRTNPRWRVSAYATNPDCVGLLPVRFQQHMPKLPTADISWK